MTLEQSHPAQPWKACPALHLDHPTSSSTTCRHFFPLFCTCGADWSPAYLCSSRRTPYWTCSAKEQELWKLSGFCRDTQRRLSFTVSSLLCGFDLIERHAASWTFGPCVLSLLSLFKHVTLCGSTEWEVPPHTPTLPPPLIRLLRQVREPPTAATPGQVRLNFSACFTAQNQSDIYNEQLKAPNMWNKRKQRKVWKLEQRTPARKKTDRLPS